LVFSFFNQIFMTHAAPAQSREKPALEPMAIA
jgi:hypothetical protein